LRLQPDSEDEGCDPFSELNLQIEVEDRVERDSASVPPLAYPNGFSPMFAGQFSVVKKHFNPMILSGEDTIAGRDD
jgi:hypothetical protein